MKRFVDNLPNGTPIINSDFHDILQEQHRIAYSAYYDGLNDEKYSTFSSDRGIIIKGCEVTNVTPVSNPVGAFDYTIDFTDSLVYFDGQFCEPHPDLLNTTANISSTTGFYLYPVTSSRTADFRDGTTHSITIDYLFNWTTNTSNISSGLSYIVFKYGGTARRLSRLLRLSAAVKDDILISSDVVKWTYPTSWGNPPNSLQTLNTLQNLGVLNGEIWRDFNVFNGTGRNEMKGFRILTEMGGRFMVGYDGLSSPTPSNAGLLQFNYGTPSNYGGTHSLTFSKAQLPAHNHGGFTSKTDQNLNHAHQVRVSFPPSTDNFPTQPTSDTYDYNYFSRGFSSDPVNFLTREVPIFINSNMNSGSENTDIGSHIHPISPAGGNIPHENRPPYSVVLYYTKI